MMVNGRQIVSLLRIQSFRAVLSTNFQSSSMDEVHCTNDTNSIFTSFKNTNTYDILVGQ